MGGISMWQLLIVLAIIILLFGTRKLPNLGADLGKAIKGFRKSMDKEDDKSADKANIIEVDNTTKKTKK